SNYSLFRDRAKLIGKFIRKVVDMELTGHQIAKSSSVESLVQNLVQEVLKINQQITSVRPADPGHAENAKKQMDQIAQLRGRPIHYPYMGAGAGRGDFVELEDGSVKLDLINGIGSHLFGHSHPRVLAAGVRGALSDIVNQGNLQPNMEYLKMSEK